MKTIRNQYRRNRGSVLFVTLIATAIIGIALASYLQLVNNQNYSVARSQAWNRAIPVLEAGIEDAMAQLNFDARPASLIGNGWSLEGTNYVNTTQLTGEFASVKIALMQNPVILSQGHTRTPAGNGDYLSRTVRVTTSRMPLFNKAMAADGLINLMGNNIVTDSFDSSDPYGSVNGRYHVSVRRANGDVATNGDLVNVGNADIYGAVSTGPGGTNSVNSNGAVGDLAWHAAGNPGIQPGYSTDDMNVDFPDRLAPFTVGLPPMGDTVDGTNYLYVLSGMNAEYSMGSLSLSGNGSGNSLLVRGDVTLYVAGNVSISGSAGIVIEEGARLRLYVAGASTSVGGHGVINTSGNAANFSYYGLPTNTSVSFSGSGNFVGTIYAPAAALRLGGGGNTTYNFVGATVSKTVHMNGHFQFHYDEALAQPRPDDYYVITSWHEL
jgi:hypothetical protein